MNFFTDPVLRAPLLGAMLMCLASSLVGVMAFLKKRSLVGEVLSHASYPGVVLGGIIAGTTGPSILIGAGIAGGLGLGAIGWLEKRLKVTSDAALCFVLSSFLGIGLVIASRIQISHALLYRQIQGFFYGQVVTLTDTGVIIYGALALLTIAFIVMLFRHVVVTHFDPLFAKTIGIRVDIIEKMTFALLVFAVVIGIRCVGVALMAAMLIAPPVAARQLTNKLSHLFLLSGAVGVASGFIGVLLSLQGSHIPTGPMIVLTASGLAILSLLFAPQRGLVSRAIRIVRFRWQCQLENGLKACWKKGEFTPHGFFATLVAITLRRQGWMRKNRLTPDGEKRAAHIVRLHRLWEVYLVKYLGASAEKVHCSAEQMEHIITPQLEQEITALLGDVKQDPHQQPIPPKAVF